MAAPGDSYLPLARRLFVALRSRYIWERMKKSRKVAGTSGVPRNSRIAIAIMAAGKGTRLKSQLAKVLHEVGGKPLLAHVIAAAVRVVPAQDVYAIIGHDAERVRAQMESTGIHFVLQR